MLWRNSVAFAPFLIHVGSKEGAMPGAEMGATLKRSSVYSDTDPSLKATV
jgi:hypothetical protein